MGIEISGDMNPEFAKILTTDAMNFVADLHNQFNPRRKNLLEARKEHQLAIDNGKVPGFLKHTQSIRNANWLIDTVPDDLQERRVEITGPTERKMIINALNSGADCFMADFEDSNSPTWSNIIEGQINLRDAVNRTIEFTNPAGKHYKLNDKTATLLVRTRGWHLVEKHFLIDGEPVSGGIFDFGLYFYHNARNLLSRGTGPYFYLPKIQNHLEAWLWNDIFEFAQDKLNIPKGTIKATVLLEHILSAFETEEILYALKRHSSGLNCGRWDYIFSIIKTFSNNKDFVLPDRSQITMTVPCMEAYCKEVVRACHKRGAHAMGGMAAQIPIKNNPTANEEAMEAVRADKEREVDLGHDGTWVAHPGLVSIAHKAFEKMSGVNQLTLKCDYVVQDKELLEVPTGTITSDTFRKNINIGVQYLEAWISGNGCVPLYNLMEDAATCEISRTQIWQWIKHKCVTIEGEEITHKQFKNILAEELKSIENEIGKEKYQNGQYVEAATLFSKITLAEELEEFLTLSAYELL